jgi:NitT/TauT family transport system permease protein
MSGTTEIGTQESPATMREAPAPGAAQQPTNRARSRLKTTAPIVISTAAVIAIWWLLVLIFNIQPILLPTPGAVVGAFFRLPGLLIHETGVTLVESVGGFLIAVVVGLAVSIALVAYRPVERALFPLLVGVNAIPKLALAPLLLVWLGFGLTPKLVMVILVCFFPIVVASVSGLMATPAELGELASSLTASQWRMFVKIRFPWALPQIFVGLKLAASLAVIGSVVAEFPSPEHGLGSVVSTSGQQADTALAFAAIVLLSIVSIGLFYLVVLLERLLLPWHRETSA